MNNDYKTRNKIIFGVEEPEGGDCINFEDLNLDQLNQLIDQDFIDMEECQNLSPTTEDFFEFMKKYPGTTAHGHAVSHTRDDYRVTLEGLSYSGKVTTEMLKDFIHLCRLADEFDIDDKLYSWWD